MAGNASTVRKVNKSPAVLKLVSNYIDMLMHTACPHLCKHAFGSAGVNRCCGGVPVGVMEESMK